MKVRVAHSSLQYSDSPSQHTSDIEKLFKRANLRRYGWITGTEAGPGANNTSDELERVGREHGYHMYVPSAGKGQGWATDCWLGVRKDLISGNWEDGFDPIIPGSKELYADLNPEPKFPRWGPKGLVRAAFDCDALQGRVNICAAHYLTGGRNPDHSTVHGVDHFAWNGKLAEAVGAWAKEVGHGRNLAFYAGDQNMADAKNDQPQGDTFYGEPLTSLADELKDWQNSGHGPIDVIASYNRDGRVTGANFRVFDDSEFKLETDHFLLEGVFEVAPLKA